MQEVKKNIMNTRDLSIDVLRYIGLSLIILAHVSPPMWIAQLRTFDVPLMVFISGLTASSKLVSNYSDFIFKRTKRLLVPVWLFLACYLSFFYFVQFKVLPEQYLTTEMIVRSFLLLDKSIGYVWIIRVFLLIMLVTPFLTRVVINIKNKYTFLSIVFLLILLQEGVCYLLQTSLSDYGLFSDFLSQYFVFLLGYAPIFMVGLRLRYAEQFEIKLCVILAFLVFAYYAINQFLLVNTLDISSSKYPPHGIYIIYGIMISCLLWACKNFIAKLSSLRFVVFVGQNTIWIYLWHMPLALAANFLMSNWFFKLLFVYVGACSLFYIQYLLVKKINNKLFNKYLVG